MSAEKKTAPRTLRMASETSLDWPSNRVNLYIDQSVFHLTEEEATMLLQQAAFTLSAMGNALVLAKKGPPLNIGPLARGPVTTNGDKPQTQTSNSK